MPLSSNEKKCLSFDGEPLMSVNHPKLWGFKTNSGLLNYLLDWVTYYFKKPKLTESNLEHYDR